MHAGPIATSIPIKGSTARPRSQAIPRPLLCFRECAGVARSGVAVFRRLFALPFACLLSLAALLVARAASCPWSVASPPPWGPSSPPFPVSFLPLSRVFAPSSLSFVAPVFLRFFCFFLLLSSSVSGLMVLVVWVLRPWLSPLGFLPCPLLFLPLLSLVLVRCVPRGLPGPAGPPPPGGPRAPGCSCLGVRVWPASASPPGRRRSSPPALPSCGSWAPPAPPPARRSWVCPPRVGASSSGAGRVPRAAGSASGPPPGPFRCLGLDMSMC